MSTAPSNPSIGRLPSGVVFAAGLVLTTGSLHFIWGLTALTKARYFDAHGLLTQSLSTWGWIYLVIGVMQIAVAAMIFTNKPWGYALGMFGAFLSIMVDFLTVGAYPIWSVILMVLSFIVFFQLATNLEK
jgi:hypothetical protein